jgi:hypothetical protein
MTVLQTVSHTRAEACPPPCVNTTNKLQPFGHRRGKKNRRTRYDSRSSLFFKLNEFTRNLVQKSTASGAHLSTPLITERLRPLRCQITRPRAHAVGREAAALPLMEKRFDLFSLIIIIIFNLYIKINKNKKEENR